MARYTVYVKVDVGMIDARRATQTRVLRLDALTSAEACVMARQQTSGTVVQCFADRDETPVQPDDKERQP